METGLRNGNMPRRTTSERPDICKVTVSHEPLQGRLVLAVNARLDIMVALDSDVPYFYWTFDDFDDLKAERKKQGFESSVWKSNAILSYSIGASYLTFDSPEEWDEGSRQVSFACTANGRYEHQFEDTIYSGVRADTQSHVVLTGRWTQTDYGKGVFILVLPIKEGEQIPEPLAEAVPLPSETAVAAAVVR